MRRSLFAYDLPAELVASRPASDRDGARLLIVNDEANEEGRAGDGARGSPEAPAAAPHGRFEHAWVRDLDRHLAPGSLLVVNDTRVIPARLIGRKLPTGGRVEILLARRIDGLVGEGAPAEGGEERWQALGRASKPLRDGTEIAFFERDGTSEGEGSERGTLSAGREILRACVVGRADDGRLLDVLLRPVAGSSVAAAIEAVGRVPLPPYLHRADDADDRERYQTVFARVPGAVAAPTAGLHLSADLLARLEARGVQIATVTLHVGLGTFQPVTALDLDDHRMHAEAYAVPAATARAIERARARGAPVVAVGTTVVRALETAADPVRPGHVREGAGETRLLIQPGYSFAVVDRLLTNFHLPESTLLALACAFGGTERVLAAYREAIAARYRFYSYGDAMLLSPPRGGAATRRVPA